MVKVSRSAYYDWASRLAKLITADELKLYRRFKPLFKDSRQSLGSSEMMKNLCGEGFNIGRYRTQTVICKLGLRPKQRLAHKMTTKRKYRDQEADNLLNQNFNPVRLNEVWVGDITYLRTGEGWIYVAVVMDLYSRRIVGWEISQRMTTNLVKRALVKAINVRRPKRGLVFHSDRGSQYTSRRFRALLHNKGLRSSMGDVGACWDNAVVERFFVSLTHDWILKIHQPTRNHMKKDVAAYYALLQC
jgi:putative transposase